MLKRIILIRFQETIVNRIGHFACHIELYLLEKKISNKKYFDIFFFGPNVCNTKLAEIWKKNIIVLPYFIIAPIFSTYRSLIKKKIMGTDHIIPENISRDRDVYNLLDKFPPNIKFTKKETAYGNIILNKLGLLNRKFIVLHLRDDNYLREDFKSGLKEVNINNYTKAIQYALSQNYKVVRVGKNPKNKIQIDNKNFIDYPFTEYQNDFMDLFLVYKCSLILGNHSGGTFTPVYMFRTPVVLTDFAPIGQLHSYSEKIFTIFKHHYNKKLNTELSIEEIFSINLGFTENKKDFEEKGVKLVDNSPDEIKDLLAEALDAVEKKKISNEISSSQKKEFKNIYIKCVEKYNNEYFRGDLRKWHGELKFNLGSNFVKNLKIK